MNSKFLCKLSLVLPLTTAGFFGFMNHKPAFAQLTPDNTLGSENSIVTPEQLRDLIQGGAIRGNTLFHSFEEFNVNELGQNSQIRSVFFDLQNNTEVLNILTRVTGTNLSQILGTLGVLNDALNSNDLGNANLFLLNPNGITFGENANLQLNGSFFATTADSIVFDNFTFSASGQEAPPPLLTISVPRFINFRENPGEIVNQSVAQDENGNTVGLQVSPGETLGLVGGEVQFIAGYVVAPDARVEIGAVAGNSSVSLTEMNGNYVLGYEEVETFEDITLSQSSRVNTSGGNIQIQGRDVNIIDDSLIVANTVFISTNTSSQLVIENREQVLTRDSVQGSGGNITLSVTDLVISADGVNSASTQTDSGGNIVINSDNLTIQNGEQVNNETTGGVAGGSIIISTSNIELDTTNNLTVNDVRVIINQEVANLPQELINPDDLITPSLCNSGDGLSVNAGKASFTSNQVNSNGILPAPPPEAIKPHHRTNVVFTDSEGNEFKPAMGVVMLENGMVEFVDYDPAQVYQDMYAAGICYGR